MKDGKSLVRAGDNRYHAIFMTEGDALFVAPSSLAVPLIALGAKATLQGPKGERTIKVEDLYQVPKKDGDRELTIRDDEVLTKVTIPNPKGKNASYEARQKRAHDWPLVLASVNIETEDDKVSRARVILGSVAPIPLRSEAAERAIAGKVITMETAAAAAEAAVEGARPLSLNAFKVALTRTVVKRALLAAAGNRYWEEG
jgi:xanthine dehydrogenase YagS FAD-binding subunit